MDVNVPPKKIKSNSCPCLKGTLSLTKCSNGVVLTHPHGYQGWTPPQSRAWQGRRFHRLVFRRERRKEHASYVYANVCVCIEKTKHILKVDMYICVYIYIYMKKHVGK